jgi:hypothetical protein
MTEQEVIELMQSSKSEKEWNDNADEVKRRCNGYPAFWFSAIMLSGLANRVTSAFGRDADVHANTVG